MLERIDPSTIRELNARKKPSSIDLGLGEPTLGVNLSYFEAATKWVGEHGCHYTPNAGARKNCAGWIAEALSPRILG